MTSNLPSGNVYSIVRHAAPDTARLNRESVEAGGLDLEANREWGDSGLRETLHRWHFCRSQHVQVDSRVHSKLGLHCNLETRYVQLRSMLFYLRRHGIVLGRKGEGEEGWCNAPVLLSFGITSGPTLLSVSMVTAEGLAGKPVVLPDENMTSFRRARCWLVMLHFVPAQSKRLEEIRAY